MIVRQRRILYWDIHGVLYYKKPYKRLTKIQLASHINSYKNKVWTVLLLVNSTPPRGVYSTVSKTYFLKKNIYSNSTSVLLSMATLQTQTMNTS